MVWYKEKANSDLKPIQFPKAGFCGAFAARPGKTYVSQQKQYSGHLPIGRSKET